MALGSFRYAATFAEHHKFRRTNFSVAQDAINGACAGWVLLRRLARAAAACARGAFALLLFTLPPRATSRPSPPTRSSLPMATMVRVWTTHCARARRGGSESCCGGHGTRGAAILAQQSHPHPTPDQPGVQRQRGQHGVPGERWERGQQRRRVEQPDDEPAAREHAG